MLTVLLWESVQKVNGVRLFVLSKQLKQKQFANFKA